MYQPNNRMYGVIVQPPITREQELALSQAQLLRYFRHEAGRMPADVAGKMLAHIRSVDWNVVQPYNPTTEFRDAIRLAYAVWFAWLVSEHGLSAAYDIIGCDRDGISYPYGSPGRLEIGMHNFRCCRF